MSLSEGDLVECVRENKGCEGGSMWIAFLHVKKHGIFTEASYPYRSSQGVVGNCTIGTYAGIKLTGYTRILHSEEELKEAVGKLNISLDVLLDTLL